MSSSCRFPLWPMGHFFEAGGAALAFAAAVAGVVFSIVMLIDCLKRPVSKFPHPLTKGGEYDRLIWALVIVASLWFYFLGAIVYFFAVRQAKPEGGESQ